ncbi:hypothetical protein [Streptomyces sp. NBC_00140]|uniref:hypothetical protein n=1 Tax=Streptomyces sp. NBC_00140 TaxID=2975664 RepID=UPI00225B9E3F|nr:hypothetical protein [Streptomyces sp. NBC_00140]MCX5336708.1 hypothetical protein [Streptomyces sp. NBC_00140]
MVTARSSSGKTRARFSAGPLHVLWLAALLFGFLFTHDATAHSASSHWAAGAVTSSTETHVGHGDAAEEQHHDDGRESSHPAAECASGQPQHTSGPGAPPLSQFDGQLPRYGVVAGKSGPPANRSAPPSLLSSTDWAVQQV